jgi:hypothetical protein
MREVDMMVGHSLFDVQKHVGSGAVAHTGCLARVLRAKRGKMDVDSLTIQPAGKEATAHDRVQIIKIAAVDHHSEVLP